jgi:hypothetical protein
MTTVSFPGILQFREPKSCRFFKRRFLKNKGWSIHEKWPFLLDHEFSRKRDSKFHVKIYMTKVVLLIHQMMLRVMGFGGWSADFRDCHVESVAVFELCVALTGAYGIYILHFLYLAINVPCILFHANFEDGLSVFILRDSATRYKNLEMESRKFYKVEHFQTPPSLFFQTHQVIRTDISNMSRSVYKRVKSLGNGDDFN